MSGYTLPEVERVVKKVIQESQYRSLFAPPRRPDRAHRAYTPPLWILFTVLYLSVAWLVAR